MQYFAVHPMKTTTTQRGFVVLARWNMKGRLLQGAAFPQAPANDH